MQCKNPQAFNCSAIQIRKDYPPAGQAIYLFSAGSHLLSFPNKDRKKPSDLQKNAQTF